VPNWNMLLDEIKAAGSQYDILRRKYLKNLSEITGRNIIAYYSAWLHYLENKNKDEKEERKDKNEK
jgi:hypothetical protein